MLKKTLATATVAGALVFTGAAAANAAYTPGVDVTASPAVIGVNATSTVTATGIPAGDATVTFIVHGSGATLSSVVTAANIGVSITKSVTAGTASADFASADAGTYPVDVVENGPKHSVLGHTVVTVVDKDGAKSAAATTAKSSKPGVFKKDAAGEVVSTAKKSKSGETAAVASVDAATVASAQAPAAKVAPAAHAKAAAPVKAVAAANKLPNTGGEFPTAALWIGAGALGLGGIAVTATAARRRASQR